MSIIIYCACCAIKKTDVYPKFNHRWLWFGASDNSYRCNWSRSLFKLADVNAACDTFDQIHSNVHYVNGNYYAIEVPHYITFIRTKINLTLFSMAISAGHLPS